MSLVTLVARLEALDTFVTGRQRSGDDGDDDSKGTATASRSIGEEAAVVRLEAVCQVLIHMRLHTAQLCLHAYIYYIHAHTFIDTCAPTLLHTRHAVSGGG